MAQLDLTTLDAVKQYAVSTQSLGPSVDDDPLLSSLITAASQMALNYLSRPGILSTRRIDTFTGQGGKSGLQSWAFHYQPVTAVYSLGINGKIVLPIPAASLPIGSGFTFDPWDGVPPGALQFLRLSGYSFASWGLPNNCTVTYQAGYAATENLVVPATPFRLVPASPQGLLARDEGVIYTSTKVPLVPIASGTPSVGQYVPPNPLAATSPTNFYQFAAADAAAGVSISYSFIPSGLEIAVRMWVGEIYKYRGRIGEQSSSQGGVQTAAYNIKAIPDMVKMALEPFNTVNFVS